MAKDRQFKSMFLIKVFKSLPKNLKILKTQYFLIDISSLKYDVIRYLNGE